MLPNKKVHACHSFSCKAIDFEHGPVELLSSVAGCLSVFLD